MEDDGTIHYDIGDVQSPGEVWRLQLVRKERIRTEESEECERE